MMPTVEEKAGDRAKVVEQQIAIHCVQLQDAGPHGQVLVPAAQLFTFEPARALKPSTIAVVKGGIRVG